MNSNTILHKEALNPTVTKMVLRAGAIAAKALPGQFVILRVRENGERIPLTIAGYDRAAGEITIIFQVVGATTMLLNELNEGDCIPDLVGPLGKPTELAGLHKVLVVGGGVGCAIALPIAMALQDAGCAVSSVIGFRNEGLVILENEFAACSDDLTVMTDDGSAGRKGNVCLPLRERFAAGETFDRIFAIGPLVMMKYVVEEARPTGIPCTVSMNPIMIDGTGMCGGCRLGILENGKTVIRFACVDGPDFDGYSVNFDEAILRNRAYQKQERTAYEETCRLLRQGEES